MEKKPVLEFIFKPKPTSKLTKFEIFYEDVPLLIKHLNEMILNKKGE